MKAARLRLIIASMLLFGWLGYLAFLVLFERDPVVLSRSQIMASTHFVLAEVRVDPATNEAISNVEVKEDLRPMGTALTGITIRVRNIKEARHRGDKGAFDDRGLYLLTLSKIDDATYELTPPPRAPGHDGPIRPRPWAYRWDDPGVQEQFNRLVPKQ